MVGLQGSQIKRNTIAPFPGLSNLKKKTHCICLKISFPSSPPPKQKETTNATPNVWMVSRETKRKTVAPFSGSNQKDPPVKTPSAEASTLAGRTVPGCGVRPRPSCPWQCRCLTRPSPKGLGSNCPGLAFWETRSCWKGSTCELRLSAWAYHNQQIPKPYKMKRWLNMI